MVELGSGLEICDSRVPWRGVVRELDESLSARAKERGYVHEGRTRIGHELEYLDGIDGVEPAFEGVRQLGFTDVGADKLHIWLVSEGGLEFGEVARGRVEQGEAVDPRGPPKGSDPASWPNLQDIHVPGQRKVLVQDLIADREVVKRGSPEIRQSKRGARALRGTHARVPTRNSR